MRPSVRLATICDVSWLMYTISKDVCLFKEPITYLPGATCSHREVADARPTCETKQRWAGLVLAPGSSSSPGFIFSSAFLWLIAAKLCPSRLFQALRTMVMVSTLHGSTRRRWPTSSASSTSSRWLLRRLSQPNRAQVGIFVR